MTTAAGRMPAVMAQAGWTDERRAVAETCATWLAGLADELVACLDQAHAAGMFVPPKAAEAAGALRALERAWSSNSRGEPAHPADKAALGLA